MFAMAALRWRHIDIFVLETIYADSDDLLHIFLFTIQYAMHHFLSLFTVAALQYHHMQQYPRGFLSSSNVTVELLWYIQKLEISLGPLVGVGRSKMIETLL
jgi:hypothetical protein